ncbi:sulfatase, partial [bacterium]|nr:sulfatase [bacterium]
MQQTASNTQTQLPNVVIIYTDDQGWADIGVNGAEGFETPCLDRMAAEGVRFTDFYVAQPVCGASRTALLTGCYPNRVGIYGAPGPGSKIGINENEMLISELLKQKDYATAIFGKWHLGDHQKFLPLQHGFDEYYGLPYSNDMWPFHPETDHFPKLPLFEGNEIIKYNPDQTQLTRDYTFRAMKFIEKNQHRPFFLYLAHNMPHVPLHVSDTFRGKSKRGLYGDVIMEIDWSVGRVMSSLRRFGLTENTLVIFASDNGPWISYGDHAGSAGPLREAKGTTWDGGVRTPCLMRWPGTLPAGQVCSEPAMTIDILPTVAG